MPELQYFGYLYALITVVIWSVYWVSLYLSDQVLSMWTLSTTECAYHFLSICSSLLAMPEYWKGNLFKCICDIDLPQAHN